MLRKKVKENFVVNVSHKDFVIKTLEGFFKTIFFACSKKSIGRHQRDWNLEMTKENPLMS